MCSTYKHSFVLPLIITNLDINEQNTPIGKFAYAVLIFSFIALFCFINILGYGIAYFLIQNSNEFVVMTEGRVLSWSDRSCNMNLDNSVCTCWYFGSLVKCYPSSG